MKFYTSIVTIVVSIRMLVKAGEAEFEDLVARLENDVIKLAREVERLHKNRCTEISLQKCSSGNYDECSSLYPNQVCPGGEDLNIELCGDGISCSAFYDYSISSVAIPKDVTGPDGRNPTDDNVIETICFTQQLDQFFMEQRAEQEQYWKSIGSNTPQLYFGAKNGAFRIYPARHSEACGEYDPRLRPWYIAAGSGPKNIVLVLDTSGSMMEGERLDLMKKAAKQVVNSMTVADRIAIVEFNSGAFLHGRDNKFLFTATQDNINFLSDTISNFKAEGGTNFLDAFTKTFQVLEDTVTAEFHVRSATAILFLTDGEMTEPKNVTEESVLSLVTTGISSLQESIGQPVFLFTYSVTNKNENVHQFPKKIACATGDYGVWSKVVDDSQIFDSLTSYYQLFALGLGVGQNENFTAWVEPYPYASGNILGTTVSAPVYDRTKNPALFLGVVGIDFPVSVIDRVLGISMGSQDSIDRIVKQSTAFIPEIELQLCELESFRRIGSVGDDGLCTTSCNATDFVQVEELECGLASDYPANLFINEVLKGKSYEERACCAVNVTMPDMINQCNAKSKDGLSIGGIVGIVLGGLAAVLICCSMVRGSDKSAKATQKLKAPSGIVPVSSLHPMPPPQNPSYNPNASAPMEFEA